MNDTGADNTVQTPQIGTPFDPAGAAAPATRTPAPAETVALELKDIKPPVALPFPYLPYIISLAVLILAAAAGSYIRRRLMRKPDPVPAQKPDAAPEPAPAKNSIPSDAEALERLAILAREFELKHDFKSCHAGVSETMRLFIARKKGINALESTTGEIEHLLTPEILHEPERSDFLSLLRRCDMVKFANYPPADDETTDLLAQAVRLVKSISAPVKFEIPPAPGGMKVSIENGPESTAGNSAGHLPK